MFLNNNFQYLNACTKHPHNKIKVWYQWVEIEFNLGGLTNKSKIQETTVTDPF